MDGERRYCRRYRREGGETEELGSMQAKEARGIESTRGRKGGKWKMGVVCMEERETNG